jgi:serine/threonine protein kinase
MVEHARLRRYFSPSDWVNRALEVLRARDRDRGDTEYATFDIEAFRAAGLCDDEDDWTILTNRLASDRGAATEIVLTPTRTLHYWRHRAIRGAIDQAIVPGPPRVLNLAKLMAESAASRRDVESVVETMVQGRPGVAPQFDGVVRLDADRVQFQTRSVDGDGAGWGPQHYPHVALVGLYQPREVQLGAGAWGVVAAHELTRSTTWADHSQRVAVKLVPEEHLLRMVGTAGSTVAETRILREFLLGRRHQSRRLVRTYDVLKVDLYGNSRKPAPHFVLVMELVSGGPLGAERVSTMGLDRRFRIAVSLTRAVADFHDLGVHRDVKPGNAILRDGTDADVVLVDYGIAKGEDDDTITDTHANFAALYAPPQQLERPADEHPADDVYALGLSLAELLLARKPFERIPRVRIFSEKLRGPFSDNELRSSAPTIAKLVERMTSPEREERPSIEAVLETLLAVGGAFADPGT